MPLQEMSDVLNIGVGDFLRLSCRRSLPTFTLYRYWILSLIIFCENLVLVQLSLSPMRPVLKFQFHGRCLLPLWPCLPDGGISREKEGCPCPGAA